MTIVPDPAGDPRAAPWRDEATSLTALVRLAGALLANGEAVDLTGMDQQVGRLCATVVDLPPAQGRELLAELIALGGAMDELSLVLRANPPPD